MGDPMKDVNIIELEKDVLVTESKEILYLKNLEDLFKLAKSANAPVFKVTVKEGKIRRKKVTYHFFYANSLMIFVHRKEHNKQEV